MEALEGVTIFVRLRCSTLHSFLTSLSVEEFGEKYKHLFLIHSDPEVRSTFLFISR